MTRFPTVANPLFYRVGESYIVLSVVKLRPKTAENIEQHEVFMSSNPVVQKVDLLEVFAKSAQESRKCPVFDKSIYH